MEKWQQDHLRKNLGKLIKCTKCNAELLAELATFLSVDDEAQLDAKRRSDGELAEVKLFYGIAAKRKGIYEPLTKALFDTKQTGAFQILLEGILNHGSGGAISICDINQADNTLSTALKGLEKNALHSVVIFQGSEIPLQEALQSLGDDIVQPLIEKHLNGKLLVDLIDNKRPVLVNSSGIPDSISYYIYRRMTTRYYLDPAVFHHRCNDIFVVQRINLKALSDLTKNQVTDLSSNQLESLTVRFIVLEHEDEYEDICKLSPNKPVHLIEHGSGRYTWIKTTGDISAIQRFVNESQYELTEENFLHSCLLSSHPVCISDTPGMGKTVLLTSLANRILQIHPRHLLRFIVLREFVPLVEGKMLNDCVDEELLIDIISEQASDFEFGREVVKQLLKSGEKVIILMFDGFDEVLFNQVSIAKMALQTLSKLKSVRLYVTTRPHMRDELEQCLGTLGYNILAFANNEQIDCLAKYWEQHGASTGTNLQNFAEICLDALEKNMKDSERGIAGIPLQCKMLAEVYQRDASKYSKPEGKRSDVDTGIRIRITSIFDMYQKLVDLRFKKIQTETIRKRLMMFAHMHAAIQLLFPECDDKLRGILVHNEDEIEMHELCSLGLLEKKKTHVSTPRFIHRTFAEYFLGLFTVRLLLFHDDFGMQVHRKEFLDFFTNTILLTAQTKELLLNSCKLGKVDPIKSASFQYQVICYFVNAHLKDCQTNVRGKFSWTTDADGTKLYDVLAACIVHDYPFLFHRTSEEPKTFPKIFLTTSNIASLFLLAAKHASFELFEVVHKNVKQYTNEHSFLVGLDSGDFRVTPLHVAVERGLYSIVYSYINSYNAEKLQNLKYVPHCCVAGSSHDSVAMIVNKIEIIQLINEMFPDWINQHMHNDTTPLLQANVHIKLLEELLAAGADANMSNKNGCVIHTLVTSEMTTDCFSDFILDLFVKHNFHIIHTTDTSNRTPLHALLETADLNEAVLQHFQFMGADFNAVDNSGNSILFFAVREHRSVRILECLLSYGAKMEQLNFNQDNVLHVCAKSGNHVAFEHFLKFKHVDMTLINGINKSNSTPFMLALRRGKGLPIHIISLLEEKGLKITEQVASEALKALISNKYIMAWELGEDFVAVADYLLKKGGVVTCKNGKTPWELEATKRNMQKIIQTTLSCHALLHEMEKRGITGLKQETKQDSTAVYRELPRERRVPFSKNLSLIDELESVFQKLQYMHNSFERLCISLICCNQTRTFMLLKQCLQSDLQDALKFITPPAGLVEFVQSEEEKVVILLSWDTGMSMTRIKNTIDPDANLIMGECLEADQQYEDLTVCQCENLLDETLQKAASFENKTICLVNFSDEIPRSLVTQVLADEVSWNDLASEFQTQLLLTYRVRNDVSGILDQKMYLQLKNNDLINFIHEQENSKSELKQLLEAYKQEFLEKNQFFQLCSDSDFTVTTMHVAVKRGHSSITEYLLNSVSFSEVLSLKYLVHYCIADTINDSEAIIFEKITILKLLIAANKHCIDEPLPSGLTPLLQRNVHENLIECLIEYGADIKAAVSCGKEISLNVINILERKEMSILKDIASEILQCLFCENNLNNWNLQTDFIRVCDFLIGKGGVLRCRNGKTPWELETTQKNLPKISEVTSCSSDMLAELERRGLHKTEPFGNSDVLYSKLQASVLHNSFEIICLALLSCQQIEPFVLLKLSLQCDMSHPTMFVTPSKNVVEFAYLQQKQGFFLRSWDFELSISRLQDTINSDILVINQGKPIPEEISSPLIVCVFNRISQNDVDHLSTFKYKIICLFKFADDNLEECANISEDEMYWGDLSADFQHDLLGFQVSEVPPEISQLKNEELVEFIHENFPVFTGFENEELTNENDDHLSTDIFNYFLPDKLVFCGITREELHQYLKFGHNSGMSEDDLSKLDYLIVECKEQFEEICIQTSYTLHLIEHYRGSFKLVKTQGSARNIERFLQTKTKQSHQCEDFPFCTCGEHKVGSGNLIWNVFQLPGKQQTYWVNVLDIITDMKSKATFKLGKSTNLSYVTTLFNVTFNVDKKELWRLIRNSIGGSFLQVHSARFTDLIEKLLKFINFDGKERQLLHGVAVQTLFPKLLKENVTFKVEKYVEFEILECIKESMVFVHKPLAWYFIAELALTKQSRPIVAQIQQQILQDGFESHRAKIRFDSFSSLSSSEFSKSVKTFKFFSTTFFKSLENLWTLDFVPSWINVERTNEFRMKWFHACVFGNHFHLFNLMDGAQKKIFKSADLVTLAVMTADLPIIKTVSEKFQQNSKKEIFDIVIKYKDFSKFMPQISILHVAVLRGNYHVVQYLLINKQFKLKLGQPIMRNILAYSVYDTQRKPKQVSERKRMIKLLLDSDKTLVPEGDGQSWNTPLLVKSVHVDLINYFIGLGVNVHCVNKRSQNILHVCPEYMTPQEYHKLIQVLHNREDSKIFHARDYRKTIPLHMAVRGLEVLESTLQLFSVANVDFNATDEVRNTILIWAVSHKRSLRLLAALIDCGADIHQRGQYDRTILHVAVQYGNFSALRYFISQGCNINAKDVDDDTVLHRLFIYIKADIHDTVKMLVEKGADVNAVNQKQQTPLTVALIRKKKVENRTLELLRNAGAHE